MAESLREKSRHNWTNDDNRNENIQLGCMLRIADATEKMAQDRTKLIAERDNAERHTKYWRQVAERIELSNRSLKGQITKLKKQIAKAKEASCPT